MTRFVYPYYDPNGTLESFDGYYSKLHSFYKAPPSVEGQETIVWHSTKVIVNPDIVSQLLNGQAVRKAPDEAYTAESVVSTAFPISTNPNVSTATLENTTGRISASRKCWCHIIATPRVPVRPRMCCSRNSRIPISSGGRSTVSGWWKRPCTRASAMCWRAGAFISMKIPGTLYADGIMVKSYTLYNRCVPSLPGTVAMGNIVFNLQTGDY